MFPHPPSSGWLSLQSGSEAFNALSNLVSKLPGTETPRETQIINAAESKKGGSSPKGSQVHSHRSDTTRHSQKLSMHTHAGCKGKAAASPGTGRAAAPGSAKGEFLTSRPVHHVVLGDEGRDLAVVGSLVARLLLGGFLLALLGGLLGGGTVVVIVLVLAVLALRVVLGASLQGAAAPGPRVLALPRLVPLVPLLVPVPVPVLLFVFVFLLVRCHDSPRAFFCPLTAGPP